MMKAAADTVFKIYVSLFLVAGILISVYVDSAKISLFFDMSRSSITDTFFSLFNLWGEPGLHILAVFVIGFYNVKRGIVFGCLFIINLIVITALKLYFKKPRPISFFDDSGLLDVLNISDYARILTTDTSFPSYHAAGAFALCVFLILHLRSNVFMVLLLFSAAILTAIARVYFLQHFFIDTYFGAFIGIVLAVFIVNLFKLFEEKLEKWNVSFTGLRKAGRRN